jgi:allantoinase
MRWSQAPHVVRSRNVVFPDGVRPASIHIHQGRIQRIGPHEDTGSPSLDVLDVEQLLVMPGLVDTHVHINEPGRAEWEGFATATGAAAAGGVTTLMDMPLNSIPATTNPRALDKKRRAAEGKCRVDVGFLGGVVPGNDAQLKPLWDAGVFAFKCFLVPSGVDEFRNVAATDLGKALPILSSAGAVLMVHAELPGPIAAAEPALNGRDRRSYGTYLASRPPAAETEAVKLVIELGRKHSARVHVVHVSAAESLALLQSARASGVTITAETCPHYLTIAAEQIADGATEFKCAPPIRGDDNRMRLWAGLADGTLDMVVSDHSPCPPAAKRQDTGDFFAAWGGVASLELGLTAVHTELQSRTVDHAQLCRWMAGNPARLVGLEGRKGVIAAGADADLAIFDPQSRFTIDAPTLQQRHKLTPYHGRSAIGQVMATYLRGALIFADGKLVGGPGGRLLSRTG